MPRLMSVAMTADAVIARHKTVTRRKGWTFLKPGDRLTLCRKVRGRKPGEPLARLAEVEVVTAWREPLRTLTDFNTWSSDYFKTPERQPRRPLWVEWVAGEVAREGFPGMDPAEFVRRFFIDAQGMSPDDDVTRIEWRYLNDGGA